MFASSRPIAPRSRRRLRRAATLHVRATTAPTDQRPKSPHRWRRGADGMRRRTKGGALRAPCVAHRFAAAPSPTTSSLPERRHSSSSRRRANAPAMLFSLRRTSTRVDNSFNTPSQPSGTYTEDRADRSRIFGPASLEAQKFTGLRPDLSAGGSLVSIHPSELGCKQATTRRAPEHRSHTFRVRRRRERPSHVARRSRSQHRSQLQDEATPTTPMRLPRRARAAHPLPPDHG